MSGIFEHENSVGLVHLWLHWSKHSKQYSFPSTLPGRVSNMSLTSSGAPADHSNSGLLHAASFTSWVARLFGPANDPGPKMIPKLYRKWSRDRNWFHRKQLGMAWTPWKVYGWIHIFLIILGEEKTSTSGIKKAAIQNVKHAAQNNKIDMCRLYNFFLWATHRKNKHESSKMPLLSN